MDELKINNSEQFCNLLITEYCKNGLGVGFTKRDIDVLVFYLLLKDNQYNMPEDIYRACRYLKLTETKVRNLYQDVQLRYNQYDEEKAKERFVEVVSSGAIELNGDKLKFVIREPLLRQYFEEWVARVRCFADSSFNKNIITVSKAAFSRILDEVLIDSKYDVNSIREKINSIIDIEQNEELKKSNNRVEFINILLKCINTVAQIIELIKVLQ